jgi:hypothetical protein
MKIADIIFYADKWEYPWFAAWDLAFHCIPISLIDPDFARISSLAYQRVVYASQRTDTAYEWSFGDGESTDPSVGLLFFVLPVRQGNLEKMRISVF